MHLPKDANTGTPKDAATRDPIVHSQHPILTPTKEQERRTEVPVPRAKERMPKEKIRIDRIIPEVDPQDKGKTKSSQVKGKIAVEVQAVPGRAKAKAMIKALEEHHHREKL